jgi:putative membrane protein
MFLGLSFLIGMAAEWVGVHTGLLFGNYHYGSVLGPKILAVPFIIGMNWAMLSIISAALIEKLNLKAWLEILIAALLMVFLDFLMEPVAMKLHFWSWKNQEIPLYNYVCWLAISILIQALYKRWHLNETNKVAIALFFFLTAFFSILNLQL